MSKPSAEFTAKMDVNISLYSCIDESSTDVPISYFGIDDDGDIHMVIEGFVISAEDKDLLEQARALTQDDWNLIETANLINPNNVTED